VEGGAAAHHRPQGAIIMVEPTEIQTSIGIVHVQVDGRDCFYIKSPQDFGEAWPYLFFTLIKRNGDLWEFESRPLYYPEPAENECHKKVPMPPTLVDELLALATAWADAHPEEFVRAARAEFDDLIMEMAHETFDEIARICSDAQKRFRRILDEPEFANHASTALRRRLQKEAQRLRVMRQHASGTAKAINTMAGRRPLGPENQNADQ
jgi:hypothetical protein